MRIDRELMDIVRDGIKDIKYRVVNEKTGVSYLTGGCTLAIVSMLIFTYIKVTRMLNKAGNLAY